MGRQPFDDQTKRAFLHGGAANCDGRGGNQTRLWSQWWRQGLSTLLLFAVTQPRRMTGLYLKALTCWLLVLMIGLTTAAQANQASPNPNFPSVVISTQTPGFIEVGSRMGMRTDASRSLTFDQATTQLATWQAINRASPNFGFTRDAYWFRFQIDNITGQELSRLIELPAPLIDEVNFYHFAGDQPKASYVLGDEKPFAQRTVKHQNFVMPIQLTPGLNQIYIRLASAGTIEAPFRIWDPESFHEANRDVNLIQGVLIGILLVMVVNNLFVFFSTGGINYIFYVLFVASFLLLHQTLTGFTFAYVWPNAVRWNSIAISTFIASTGLFACLFANSFLKLKEFSKPAWVLMNAFAAGCGVLVALTFFLPYSITVRLGAAIAVPVSLAALLIGCWRWWQGARFARFYCLAWTSVLIGIGILSAEKFGLIPSTIWTNHAPQMGIILSVILLSFTLVDRTNHDRSLRANAQAATLAHERQARAAQEALIKLKEETNRQLEQRVKARTSELNQTLDQLQTANDRLLLLSTTDGLTQVSNRAFFDNALATEHRRARRMGAPLGLIMFDIDHLKQVNDTYGHMTGDACLQVLAKLMRPWIHRAGDVLARYGGEEFVILLLGCNLESSTALAEKFRVAVEELQISHEGKVIHLTASFGVASGVPDQQSNPQDLVVTADKMLFLAKEGGRNCVRSSPMNSTNT
jgi:diguanylate cyclase